MEHHERERLPELLDQGRRTLAQAPAVYGRSLSAEEYWWLGVGLAAWTLADLGEKPYAAGRLEQLMDELGHAGPQGDWLQRMVDELSLLDAEGLLWPRYQRSESGQMEPTGAAVHPEFGPQEGYFLALGHLGVALAVHQEQADWLPRLTGAIGEIVTTGLTAAHEALLLKFFGSEESGQSTETAEN